MARTEEVRVPDIGDFENVDVVEVLITAGDTVEQEDPLIVLESDKASMDVPSPLAGVVEKVEVSEGDKVSQGDVIVVLRLADLADEEAGAAQKPEKGAVKEEAAKEQEGESAPRPASRDEPSGGEGRQAVETAAPPRQREEPRRAGTDQVSFAGVHASPAVRRFARELGVDLSRVEGSGRKGRILREDVQVHVKGVLGRAEGAAPPAAGVLPEMPRIDFSKFGEIERRPLSRIRRKSGPNVHRSWLHVPHVTQFDEADITELEEFRRERAAEAEQRGLKLTILSFIMKACVPALKKFPEVNASLDPDGEHLIVKRYVHIGFAVDTADGLLVPVIRDVDRKGIFDLAAELAEVSKGAREGKLKLDQMQGASFTISSLGGVGGTAFTPIVHAPEVAILGVSRAKMRPVWSAERERFEPRLMLPLSFSYDHRVIDGALAARFTTYLAEVLSDIRQILL